MKKRHQQKLIFLSLSLILLINIPFVFAYNSDVSVLGFPLFYFFIFVIWLISVVISFSILKKYSD
ncbi:hypothetical protein ES731_10220 [Psychroflexus gondwanensis]|uniref:DUF3311 domain-containing protein n=1 Tax=Psychroflexus gondwanensis ACAM 44 TaxID=1189619 RepID=N1WJT5_9FLAO|nr:hypothetical protein pgond44_11561 [Psychroflexus gondwanensis ACAM 44]TXE18232.1 hypothetical protein ES731_10220 [Psychroflexus gondwanensis]